MFLRAGVVVLVADIGGKPQFAVLEIAAHIKCLPGVVDNLVTGGFEVGFGLGEISVRLGIGESGNAGDAITK